jgi:hypothetical protein
LDAVDSIHQLNFKQAAVGEQPGVLR